MPKKPKIKVDPVDLIYIDESELQTRTEDEEWEDSYDMGYRPTDYEGEERASFEEFLKRTGYDIPK